MLRLVPPRTEMLCFSLVWMNALCVSCFIKSMLGERKIRAPGKVCLLVPLYRPCVKYVLSFSQRLTRIRCEFQSVSNGCKCE